MLRSRARRLAVPIGRIAIVLFSAHERFGDCRDPCPSPPAGDHDNRPSLAMASAIRASRSRSLIGIDGSFVALRQPICRAVPLAGQAGPECSAGIRIEEDMTAHRGSSFCAKGGFVRVPQRIYR